MKIIKSLKTIVKNYFHPTANVDDYTKWQYFKDTDKSNFEEELIISYKRKAEDVKIFAYYLPQFHPIPENDSSFGKGFTEWTNVANASPLFVGHVQPKIPYDLGFYNLLQEGVIERQIELAKNHGIYGFCFYYYWFSGKKVLEKPIEKFMGIETDFKFHIMWANENWAKLWDGGNKEVILKQEFCEQDFEAFFNDISNLVLDVKYEKKDGRPIIAIYRPSLFEKELFIKFTEFMNKKAKTIGLPGFYFVGTNATGFDRPYDYHLEGIIEFPPHGITDCPQKQVRWLNKKSSMLIFDLHKWLNAGYHKKTCGHKIFKCCFPSWDNSPRKKYSGGWIFHMEKDDFYNWLTDNIKYTKINNREEAYLYINAWNEWAEGAMLEPSVQCGYKNLNTVQRAIIDSRDNVNE